MRKPFVDVASLKELGNLRLTLPAAPVLPKATSWLGVPLCGSIRCAARFPQIYQSPDLRPDIGTVAAELLWAT